MRPERAAGLVRRWISLYTIDLSAPVAERRAEEISADMNDHIARERSRGTTDGRIAIGLLSRMVRGMPADLTWRSRVKPERGGFVKFWIALLIAALALGALALVFDSPILVLMAVATVVADILGVFWLGVTSARRGGLVVPYVFILGAALGIAALAVGAIILGDRGDAPGLMLLGVVLLVSVIVGALALGMRSAQSTR